MLQELLVCLAYAVLFILAAGYAVVMMLTNSEPDDWMCTYNASVAAVSK